ncbi:MAG: acylneuraminate cytidylyltransferase [Nitrospirae bacterium RBG_13_39_12]|nr:MAG: acylneuraminate cytidylyltransferase [Nitrospirae bacterium RBG_13_39_12]
MKIIALLPMKGHSERVTNKNMRDFCGRPLYHAVMESLLQSKYISNVVINTDSNEIKKDALRFFKDDIVIHDRPESIQGDFVSMNRIIYYDIERLEGDYFLQTHSTNPLLKSKTIDRAIERYSSALTEGYDSLFSVTRFQTRLYDSNGRAINHNPGELIRTQDLPPVYEENSCLYIFSRKSFWKKKRRIGENPFMFEIPREEAWDIDEEIDFEIAEFFYKKLHAD